MPCSAAARRSKSIPSPDATVALVDTVDLVLAPGDGANRTTFDSRAHGCPLQLRGGEGAGPRTAPLPSSPALRPAHTRPARRGGARRALGAAPRRGTPARLAQNISESRGTRTRRRLVYPFAI